MSHLWKFSPGLEEQLQQCIAAASHQGNNKWQRMFSNKNVIEHSNLTVTTQDPKTEEIEIISESNDLSNYEDLIEAVEAEPVLNLSELIRETQSNVDILNILPTKMSLHSIEKLCMHIFNNNDISNGFLSNFYTLFLSNVIKHSDNVHLDFLIQAKNHHTHMKKLIRIFVTDIEMPHKLLQDFITTLNEDEKTEFMINISQLEMHDQIFLKNMFSIYLAYRDCAKMDSIQSFVLTYLRKTSSLCVTDKMYGKLLLTFLQTEKSQKCMTNISATRELIELHQSPFHRPCKSIYNEIIEISGDCAELLT